MKPTKRTIFRPTYEGTKSELKQPYRKKKYPKEWFKLRYKFLKAHPVCAVKGCGRKAEQVDHVVPLAIAPERMLDWYNLQSLCWDHHKEKSKLERFGDGRPKHLKSFL